MHRSSSESELWVLFTVHPFSHSWTLNWYCVCCFRNGQEIFSHYIFILRRFSFRLVSRIVTFFFFLYFSERNKWISVISSFHSKQNISHPARFDGSYLSCCVNPAPGICGAFWLLSVSCWFCLAFQIFFQFPLTFRPRQLSPGTL